MLDVRPFSPRDKQFLALLRRNTHDFPALDADAKRILDAVRDGGSHALAECLQNHPGLKTTPDTMRVTVEEFHDARNAVSEQFLTSLSLARVNIRRFHEYQRRRGYVHDGGDGVRLSRVVRPLQRVGICCGSSFMALLMHAIPAQAAGVHEIVVAASPGPDGKADPRVLATAKSLGLEEVYALPGAEAVAAMTFGAGGMERVDKIVGPGDSATRAAKRLVAGMVGVDGELGLGELVVAADESANAKFIAGDLLAQAEHGAGLLALLTTDRLLAEAVRIETGRLAERLPNREAVLETLENSGAIYLFPHLDAVIDAANMLAPARLSLMTTNNDEYLSDVETAGAVFVGPWSTEAVGDFFSGINSYLPVGGSARHSSGLGVDDFIREIAVVEYGPDRLLMTGRHMGILAEEERLPAHAEAVRDRIELLKLAVE